MTLRDIDVSEGLDEFKRLEKDGWRSEKLSSYWGRYKERGSKYAEALYVEIRAYQRGKFELIAAR